MPLPTLGQWDEDRMTTGVVYNHSLTKLVSRKAKARPSKVQAFLSVLRYKRSPTPPHRVGDTPTSKGSNLERTRCTSGKGRQSKRKQVFVRSTLLPKTLSLQLVPETSIASLKELIQSKISIDAQHQHLYIRRNFELCDLLTLEDHGILKDETIELRLATDGLLGGGPKEERQRDDEVLCDISSKIGEDWRRLAIKLGFDEAEIEVFESNNRDNMKEQCRMMLAAWLIQLGDISQAKFRLKEALTESGRADLASEVAGTVDNCLQVHVHTADCNREQSLQLGLKTTPEHQKPGLEQVGDLDRPQLEKQVTDFREHSSQQEMMTSAEKHRPEQEQADGSLEQATRDSEQSSEQGMKPSIEHNGLRQEQACSLGRPQPDDQQLTGDSKLEQNSQPLKMTSPEQYRPVQEQAGSLDRRQSEKQQVAEVSEQSSEEGIITLPDEQQRLGQGHAGNLDILPSALCPAAIRQPSLVSALRTAASLQPVSVDVNVGGSNNPTFLAPAIGNTLNFIQNVTVAGNTSGEFNTSIQSDTKGSQCGFTRRSQGASLAQAAADECRKEIRARYTTTGSYVQMIPWVDDDKKHIMDIYTKLKLENDGLDKVGKVETYEDIFLIKTREGHPIKLGILCGSAGLGKSTLIDKMSYDWATDSCCILRKYTLVFVLKMCALEQSSNLIDSVFDQLLAHDTAITKCDLKAFIDAKPQSVLILMDGFDEFMTTKLNENEFGSVLNILNRKEYIKCCVLVTTRPSHYATLVSKPLVEKPFTLVRVLGFTEKDIGKYVNRFFSEEHIKAEQLLERIKSSNVLSDLAKSPMLLLLMCLLWRQDATLPCTMSRLFDEALRYIFKRKAMSLDDLSEVVIAIGKKAHQGLFCSVQRLSFQEREFENSVLDMALRAGILTSQRVLKGLDTHNSIQFIHKTFQEFCAAKYCQNVSKKCPKSLALCFPTICIANIYSFGYILRFSCGDNNVCTEFILRLLNKAEFMGDGWQLILNCLFESQSTHLMSLGFVRSSLITETMYISANDCLNSLMWFLKQITDETKLTGNAYFLSKVRIVVLLTCNVSNFSVDMASSLGKMSNLSTLEMIDCSLTGITVNRIMSSLRNTAIRELTFQNCDLNIQDVKCIAATIVCMGNLVNVSVDAAGGGCFLVKPVGTGIFLVLERLRLSATDLVDILRSFSNRTDLLSMDLGDIVGLHGSAALWAHHLKQLKHLHKLTLCRCELQSTDMEHIFASLSNMPCFVKLYLSAITSLGGTAQLWAAHLQQMTHIKRLAVRKCSLQSTDIEPIAASLSGKPDLVRLDLRGNTSLGGSAETWASCLRQLKHVGCLELSHCSLTDKDRKYIAQVRKSGTTTLD